MPIYEFECEACHEEFEDLVSSLGRIGEVECPKCGSGKVQRLQSGFATIGGGSSGFGASKGCSSTGPIG
jgi:putative FmdB family regulatory protein